MQNLRAYYSVTIEEFLRQSDREILGCIHGNEMSAETRIQQNHAWQEEIAILKNQLCDLGAGQIIFEYVIPRMGKRVDAVILYANIVFLLEFKIGDTQYRASSYDQVYDYALDLRNFHKESHDKLIVSIIVASDAVAYNNEVCAKKKIIEPLRCNKDNIGRIIQQVADEFQE